MAVQSDYIRIFKAAERYRLRFKEFDAAIAEDPEGIAPQMDKAKFLYETNSRPAALSIAKSIIGREPANADAVVLTNEPNPAGRDDEAVAILNRYVATSRPILPSTACMPLHW
jgi:hypothetical protein